MSHWHCHNGKLHYRHYLHFTIVTIITCDRFSEPDSKELQEAISKTTFQHDLVNLDPATTYSIYLKAYSALGASPASSTVVATTLGGGRDLCTALYNTTLHGDILKERL